MSSAMKKQKTSPTLKEYSDFVKQIDIDDIRIISAQVNMLDYSYSPSSIRVKWRVKASYEKVDEGGFKVFNRYNVTLFDEETKENKAKISVTFLVIYSSKIPIDDELFNKFAIRNLPLNTWPYFREFVHNITVRMGWSPLIAPTYVV